MEKSDYDSLESLWAMAALFGVEAKEFISVEVETNTNPVESVMSSLLRFDDSSGKAGRYE